MGAKNKFGRINRQNDARPTRKCVPGTPGPTIRIFPRPLCDDFRNIFSANSNPRKPPGPAASKLQASVSHKPATSHKPWAER
jgi:hypothetical protein